MTRLSRNRVRFFVPAVAFAAALLLAQAAPAQMCNAEAHDWVKAHSNELPKSYEELTRFPLNYRQAIYTALDAETRSGLWQAQLELALQREDLTDAQRDVLLEAVQIATPETFAAAKNRRERSRVLRQVEDFDKRARAAFGEKAVDLFGRLGPADLEFLVVDHRQAQSTTEGQGVRGVNSALTAPLCSCSTDSDWCNNASHCVSGGCTLVRDECGTFWAYDCNGQCIVNGTTLIEINRQ